MKDEFGNVEITFGMLATRGKRFANYIIDGIVTTLLTVAVMMLNLHLEGNNNLKTLEDWIPVFNSVPFQIYGYGAIIIYYGLMESVVYRSFAKYITATRVVMRDGTEPDAIAILIRTVCRLIPFEFISFLGLQPVGWHDRLSKTVVVDVYEYKRALLLKQSVEEIGKQD